MQEPVDGGNRPDAPPRCRWRFDPDVPTYDFFGRLDLTSTGDMEELVEDFVYYLEQRKFLIWEAVICQEQCLELTQRQKDRLAEVSCFQNQHTKQIFYIDDIPRPSLPWYEILRKLAPHLLVVPFRTWDMHSWEVHLTGWMRIAGCLEDHGQDLSLPEGVSGLLEVVPADLRHQLGLQCCFTRLDGLGQADHLTLADPYERSRIEGFIEELQFYRESIGYLALTLEKLFEVLILPEQDRRILAAGLKRALGLCSPRDPIADHF